MWQENARKHLTKSQKRIAELDKLFTRIYEDNVSGKLSDERFEMMSKSYESEQKQLKNTVSELSAFIETKEQKSADVSQFVGVIKKYEHIDKLTAEIMRELIERIEIHAPDKSDGHRKQQIDIYYRFNVATAMVIADRREYTQKRKAA